MVAFYHDTLKNSPEALRYLESRGLKDPEMLDRFKLGFANRTLGLTLPDKNRKDGAELRGRLQRLGILRAESGHEHMNGSVVFPIFSLAVTQGTQLRTFTYDTLGRLKTATNPESGTVSYTYDGNGNVLTRADARGTVCYGTWSGSACSSTAGYDALNRPLRKTYSNGEPGVTYTYDQSLAIAGHLEDNYPDGRLVKASVDGGSSTTYRYDALGRPAASWQQTAGQDYIFGYVNSPAGGVKQETYPSGRVVSNTYWSNGLARQVDSGTTRYAGAASYAAHGGLRSVDLANGALRQTVEFNDRLQPVHSTLLKVSGQSTVWDTTNVYTTTQGCTQGRSLCNNGDVRSQTTTASGTTYSQAYTYDGLSRLKTAVETGGWSQRYVYDRWGNRALLAGYYVPGGMLTPQVPSDNAADVAAIYPNNRWSGATYDGGTPTVGNQTALAGYTLTYDAENRLATSKLGAGGQTAYGYDGEGRRVLKTKGGKRTVYVYDAGGALAAEYSEEGSTESGTRYLASDHLGSTRMVTDAAGTCKEAHDYLPFGEEIGADYRPGPCYQASNVRLKFTGKERDEESGLDYFGARYYSGAQGRWTSPDLINLTWDRLGNPSNTLNKYVYAANNPLKFTDPDGQDITLFYRTSTSSTDFGDYGHAFLAAYDQSANQVEFLDYYPAGGLQRQGLEMVGPGAVNTGTFDERRSGYVSLTIQTTPEITQKVMAFMRDFKAHPGTYRFPTNTCVTACRAALEVAGIRVSAYSPAGLWNALYRRYSPSYRMMLADGKSMAPPISSRPGMDSGSPRTDPMVWQRFLFDLWLRQVEQQRAEEERRRREEVTSRIIY